MTEKRLLTIKEAATYLGIATQTLYNRTMRKSKNPFPVKPRRIGRAIRFDKIALDKWIEEANQELIIHRLRID